MLFTVDTLRADALGCYGAAGAPSPNVDRLASESLLFERAYSQATFTHPALSSLLTGFLPPRHRVETQSTRLSPSARPVQVQLSEHGVATGSFVANLCDLQEVDRTVFRDGWDERFCGMDWDRQHYEWDEDVVTAALAWIAGREEAYFCWIHLMDPHAEHHPPPAFWDHAADPLPTKSEQYASFGAFERRGEQPSADFVERVRTLYDAEVRGIDYQLGRLLEALDADPRGDEVAVVFSADHGEELFETWAKLGHGLSLSEGVLQVPLLVRAPGHAPARDARPTETLRVAATILDLFGIESAVPLDGSSLLSGEPAASGALSFCGDVVTLRRGDVRMWLRTDLLPRPAGFEQWFEGARYDLAPWFAEDWAMAEYAADAPTTPRWVTAETADSEDELRAGLTDLLRDRLKRVDRASGGEEVTDEAFLRQLEALGYR